MRLLLLVLLAPSLAALAQSSLPLRENFTYSIEWRLITAGRAQVESAPLGGTRAAGSQIRFHLESVGLVSKLFKVEDDYTATMNQSLCVESAHLTAHEGTRQRETRITFDSQTHKADYLERDRLKNTVVLAKQIDIPSCVHDVIGGLFVLRTLALEINQATTVPVSDGKKSVMARVEAQQREDVKTPAGTFKAIRYEVFLFNSVLYNRPAHLYIWLTDDSRKLPVQVRVRMTVTIGTITFLLEKYG